MKISGLLFGASSTIGQSTKSRHQRNVNPCPSECWTYETGKCELKVDQTCMELTCNHDSMAFKFTGDYFGIADGETHKLHEKYNTEFKDGVFHINCPLGKCDMYATIDANENLDYSINVAVSESGSVKIAGLELFNHAGVVALAANCVYETSFDVTSDTFHVSAAIADTTFTGSGDLSRGFALNIYGDKNLRHPIKDTIFIGQRIWAQVEWGVTSAQDQVNFYVNNCEVEFAADPQPVVAKVVEDNCYSSALGITKLGESSWIVRANSGFTFTSFSANSNSAAGQAVKVTCEVKLCLLSNNKCKINTSTPQCPDSGYKFTPNGCEDGYFPIQNGSCEKIINQYEYDEDLLRTPENLARKSFSCNDQNECTLELSDGSKFIGIDRDGVVDFRGVPFAIPPLNNMRWTEPLIRYNFQGETHDHRNYQKACATHQEDPYTSEDCLGINISVPRNALEESRAVPIIYNIHGGGFNQGNNRGRPGNLIKKEQVAIFNIAYRLGIFGFLTLPDVEQGQRYKTNWGLLDMIAAMKWSQTYGPLFGVNIHEASMTAYSSGAEAIWRLITIPVVWPWIQRVNIMGMGVNSEYDLLHAGKIYNGVRKSTNCSNNSCIRSKSVVELAHAGDDSAYGARHPNKITVEPGFSPVVDLDLCPQQLIWDIRDGNFKRNMPISWVYAEHDNWGLNHLAFANSLFKYLDPLVREINAKKVLHNLLLPAPYSNLIIERYFAPKDITRVLEIFGCEDGQNGEIVDCNDKFSKWVMSMNWVCNTRHALNGALSDSVNFPDLGPVYVTQFGVRNCDPGENGKNRKTCHGAEIPFIYGENAISFNYDISEQKSHALVDRMRSAWGEFFRTGNFPDETLTAWREINQSEVYNVIDAPDFGWGLKPTFKDECEALDAMNQYDDINALIQYIVENTES